MLKSRSTQIVVVLGLIGVLLVAALVYGFLRPPEEASAPISSLPRVAKEDSAESVEIPR